MSERTLGRFLLAGWLMLPLPLPALTEPALPGDIIADLRALQEQLQEGQSTRVAGRAEAQARRLAGGNAADRWSRALYLQLAARADARAGREARAAERLGEARASRVAPESWRLDRLKEEAELRHAAGQGDEALTLLQAWIDETDGDAASRWRRVRWLAELNRFEEAAAQLEAPGMTEEPTAERRALAASIHQRTGREAQALALLSAGLDADAAADDWRRAAALAQRAGDDGRAAAIWESGWRLGALTGEEGLLRLARLHLAGGTPARAAEHLERGLATGELANTRKIRRLLARAWEAARDRDRALAAWQRMAESGDDGEDWLHLGRLALAWGEESLAETALRQASRRGIEQADEWLAGRRGAGASRRPAAGSR